MLSHEVTDTGLTGSESVIIDALTAVLAVLA
jgi:hypothetical protein